MSFLPKSYASIVADLFTTLTGGFSHEVLLISEPSHDISLASLQKQPIDRISDLRVEWEAEGQTKQRAFTAADFELIQADPLADGPDTLRFGENVLLPPAQSRLVLSYYPRDVAPLPLTDLRVGSVTRTLLETVARELAVLQGQLDHVYHAAFLESATGNNLDKVVALVGVQRVRAGAPMVKLRFSRAANRATRVTIPANTPVSDAARNRYLTISESHLAPFELSREVLARGESEEVGLAEAGSLRFPEFTIDGIDQITNEEAAFRRNDTETDEALRRRAGQALAGAARGTLGSLEAGVLAIDGVRDVTAVDMPQGLPGEVRLDIVYADDDPAVRQTVAQRIDALRPAGIRVLTNDQTKTVHVSLEVWTFWAEHGPEPSDWAQFQARTESALTTYVEGLGTGGQVRQAKLVALLFTDDRILDGRVLIGETGGEVHEQMSLATDEVFVVDTIAFLEPEPEQEAPLAASTTRVDAHVPIHLNPGISQAEVQSSLTLAFQGFVQQRGPDIPITVDALAAALRDDTRYVLIREELVVVIIAGDRFHQLADGQGSYVPGPAEQLLVGEFQIDIREEDV